MDDWSWLDDYSSGGVPEVDTFEQSQDDWSWLDAYSTPSVNPQQSAFSEPQSDQDWSFLDQFSPPTEMAQREQNDLISGDSWFEKFMDAVNTPQQALFGALTQRENESALEAIERGVRSNISGTEFLAEKEGVPVGSLSTEQKVLGHAAQFVMDPLLLVPASWSKALFKPIGMVLSKAAKPIGSFLGQSQTYVNLAQKFSKTAYRGANEKSFLEMMEISAERLGLKNEEIIEDAILGTTGKLKTLAKEAGKEWGIPESKIEDAIRQVWEYKAPLAPAGMTPLKPMGPVGFSKVLQKELDLPADAREILDDLTVQPFLDRMGVPKVDKLYKLTKSEPAPWTKMFKEEQLTGMPSYDDLLTKPDKEAYFKAYKGLDFDVRLMPVDDALRLTYEANPALTPTAAKLDALREQFKNGAKFDIPMINEKWGVQEGQHRLLLAKELGLKEVPVMHVRDFPGADPDMWKLIKEGKQEFTASSVFKVADRLKTQQILKEMPEVVGEFDKIEEITRTLPFKLPQQITSAAMGLKRSMEDVLFKEYKIGAGTGELKDTWLDYVFHMTSKEAKKELGLLYEGQFGYRKFSPVHGSMITRELRGLTIDEVNRMARLGELPGQLKGLKLKGNFFEDDITAIEIFRRMRAAKLDANIQLAHDAARQFAIKATKEKPAPSHYVPLMFTKKVDDPRFQRLIPYFKDQMFEPDVAKHLNALMEFNTDPRATGEFMGLLEKIRSNWVAGTLYAFPSTMTKNEIGNILNNSLAGLNQFKYYKMASDFQRKLGKDYTISGIKYSYQDIKKMVRDMAISGGGYAPREVQEFMTKTGRELPIMKIPGVGKVLKTGEKMYRGFEDNARIAHFLWRLDKGDSPLMARASVKKYLFDYVYGLTDFERKIRTFVPFYSWLRNNLPLQLSSIIENPLNRTYVRLAEMTSAIRDNQAVRRVDQFHKDVLPDFVRDQVGIPIRNNEDGNPEYFLLGGWVPAAELEILMSPKGALNKAMNAVAPYLKMPIEQAFNYDLFLKKKIAEFPGDTQKYLGMDVPRRLVHFSKLFRFVTEADKMSQGLFGRELSEPEQDAWSRAFRLMFGGGTFKARLDFGEKKRRSEIRRVRTLMRYSRSKADREALMDYYEELMGD